MEISAMSVMSSAISNANSAVVDVMNCTNIQDMNKLVRDFSQNMNKMNDGQENMTEMMDELFEGENEGANIDRIIE